MVSAGISTRHSGKVKIKLHNSLVKIIPYFLKVQAWPTELSDRFLVICTSETNTKRKRVNHPGCKFIDVIQSFLTSQLALFAPVNCNCFMGISNVTISHN